MIFKLLLLNVSVISLNRIRTRLLAGTVSTKGALLSLHLSVECLSLGPLVQAAAHQHTRCVAFELCSPLLSLLQVEHELGLAYSKESNAIVERVNREVMRHLYAIIFDKRISVSWSTGYLPLVQRIMNAKVCDTIEVSPAELLFEKSINLYSGLLFLLSL